MAIHGHENARCSRSTLWTWQVEIPETGKDGLKSGCWLNQRGNFSYDLPDFHAFFKLSQEARCQHYLHVDMVIPSSNPVRFCHGKDTILWVPKRTPTPPQKKQCIFWNSSVFLFRISPLTVGEDNSLWGFFF